MSLDLQKVALSRLLTTRNHDYYTRLYPSYFSGANKQVFNRIESFYKANLVLPSIAEFTSLRKDTDLQDFIDSEILTDENKDVDIATEFLISQLQDFYIREETLEFLDDFVDNLDNYEKVEIIDKLQSHLMELNNSMPNVDELYDVGEMDFFPKEDDFILKPSGLSAEYDATNGGFALEELVLIGGRRGSGKSIIVTNCAIHRFLAGDSVAIFSIEMRYKEVYDRIISIVSRVPFLDIFRNKLTDGQKLQIADAKLRFFYKPEAYDLYEELVKSGNFEAFEYSVKHKRPPLKDNRLFVIDDESLTLNRIDHYNNTFVNKYPNYSMSVIDYVNIIRGEDSRDWKTQIYFADNLKTQARKYGITVMSPYQIDANMEARFAKGILDAADRSFTFMPPKEGEENLIDVFTTKIRNGKAMNFNVRMDWECVRIDPSQSQQISQGPLKGAKYGDDESSKFHKGKGETSSDLG